MAHRYPPQTYAIHAPPQWSDDMKASSSFLDDDDPHFDGDRSYEPSINFAMTASSESRRPSVVKVEEDFSAVAASQMWHDRPHAQVPQMRHYSTTAIPTVGAHPEHMLRMHSQAYAAPFDPSPTWNMPNHSESGTPTPLYGPLRDNMAVQFNSTTGTFPYQQEPHSAVAMSPQSSQGGWASTTSTDSGEQNHAPQSPKFRATSPMTVVRSDGIRKKNARFEIPKEITLDTIEQRLKTCTDEDAKKELKQQKRLLRNRQAA
jgi:hypothetical protein